MLTKNKANVVKYKVDAWRVIPKKRRVGFPETRTWQGRSVAVVPQEKRAYLKVC